MCLPAYARHRNRSGITEEKRMRTLRAAVAIDSFKGSLDSETLGLAAAGA